jgi:PadR family transcriptional regulator, regulatory protein PadR
MSMGKREEIPPGTLEVLILSTLSRGGSMHGFAIADFIQEHSEEVLRVEEGSLYPALQRMLLKGWIRGDWGKTEENRRARYYQLTAEGRRQLEKELDRYHRVARAIGRVLAPA